MKNMKRIHEVTVKHISDDLQQEQAEDHIGTFDMEAKSEYAIELPEPCRGYRYEGYTFFNGPIDNYLGTEPDEMRKYVQQDYERMKSFNAGEWEYVGVKATAKVQLEQHGPFQTITSGGLWGIESDSGDYFEEVEAEQLAELRDQLHAMGFSNRAISAAFKDVQHKD